MIVGEASDPDDRDWEVAPTEIGIRKRDSGHRVLLFRDWEVAPAKKENSIQFDGRIVRL
jgi:hypothetical protein